LFAVRLLTRGKSGVLHTRGEKATDRKRRRQETRGQDDDDDGSDEWQQVHDGKHDDGSKGEDGQQGP